MLFILINIQFLLTSTSISLVFLIILFAITGLSAESLTLLYLLLSSCILFSKLYHPLSYPPSISLIFYTTRSLVGILLYTSCSICVRIILVEHTIWQATYSSYNSLNFQWPLKLIKTLKRFFLTEQFSILSFDPRIFASSIEFANLTYQSILLIFSLTLASLSWFRYSFYLIQIQPIFELLNLSQAKKSDL